MAQNHRWPGPVIDKIDIRMADARRGQAHQDFAVPGAFQVQGFDLYRSPRPENRGLDLVQLNVQSSRFKV
jgi:hypothetical protein